MRILTAMAMHAIATYGDSLSPAETSQRTKQSFVGCDVTYPSRHPEQTQETSSGTIKNTGGKTNCAQTCPCLFLSTIPGATALMYVHVQIMRMMTNSSD